MALMHKPLKVRFTTALAVFVVLLAGACGIDGGTTASDPPSEPATPAAASAVEQPFPDDAPAESPTATRVPATVVPTAPAPTASPTALPESSPQQGAPTVLGVLNGLAVEPESQAGGYERSEFDHDRGYLCGSSGTDPYTGASFDPGSCDVDHIVAAKEAYESGAWAWDVSRRRAFGNDGDNLIASRDCVNRSKGAGDMAEWPGRVGSGVCEGLTTTAQGACFLAATTVAIKSAYSLAVDADEKSALTRALENCPPGGPMPSGPTGGQPEAAAFEAEPLSTPADGSDCHPAYSPCLPNLAGDALNCGDLTSDQKPVRVLQPGTDPYRLDRDGDGRGCMS